MNEVKIYKSKKITIKSDSSLPIHVDGEIIIGENKFFEIEIIKNSFNIWSSNQFKLKNLIIIFFLFLTYLYPNQHTDQDTIVKKREIFPASLIPGYGQLLNGKILKSIIIVSAEIYMISKFNKHRLAFNDLDRSTQSSSYLYHLNSF